MIKADFLGKCECVSDINKEIILSVLWKLRENIKSNTKYENNKNKTENNELQDKEEMDLKIGHKITYIKHKK